MSNQNVAIKELAGQLVTEALDYMGDRQHLPFKELSEDTQSSFLELQEVDGFLEKLNTEINNAEINEKQALANTTISSLESFNVAANPDLSEAITDYIMETTPNEILEVTGGEGDFRIQTSDKSMDRGLRTENNIKAALQGDFKDAGLNNAVKSENRGAQLAAKALKAQIQLHIKPPK